MSEKLRICITGFGPFPGAPFNPTGPLVARLLRLRRPALGDVELSGHIFPVTYQAVDRELPGVTGKTPAACAADVRRCLPHALPPDRDPRPQRGHHVVARCRSCADTQGIDR